MGKRFLMKGNEVIAEAALGRMQVLFWLPDYTSD